MKQEKLDFENTQFHDCNIYAIGFDDKKYKFLMDVDFILKWTLKNDHYIFDVAPSTFVFQNIWDMEIDIACNTELIIDNIQRKNPKSPRNIDYLPENTLEYEWIINLLEGQITFKSIGLEIYQRSISLERNSQTLSMQERGYISLIQEGMIKLSFK